MKNFWGILFTLSKINNNTVNLFSIDHQRAVHKRKKLDCFEHNSIFCFKLQCASIVVLLGTAIWWKLKDAVVHWQTPKCNVVLCLCLTFKINTLECQGSRSLSVYAGVNVTCRTADSTLNLFGYLVVVLYYHHHVNRSCLSSQFDHVGKLL